MWIKICGNTNLEDAQLAASLGADAVGFVFAPSVRRVTAAQVAKITPHLPERVERVGVFPALDADEIVAIAEEAGLNSVQLHGGVDFELVRRLRERLDGQVGLIQAVHWDINAADGNVEILEREIRAIAAEGLVQRVLVDSKVASAMGGTGVSFNWNAARRIFSSASGVKLIVAGGLRAENVGEALRILKPWGADVASGVEESPGRKSWEKIGEFIRAARTFDDRL